MDAVGDVKLKVSLKPRSYVFIFLFNVLSVITTEPRFSAEIKMSFVSAIMREIMFK